MTEAVDPGLAIARFFTFGLAMFAFGQAAFEAAISAQAPATRVVRVAVGSGLAVSALAYLTLLAREASGSSPPSLVAALAVSTGFGRALSVTAFAGLELALWARPPQGLQLAFAAAGLGALAFVGHAADGEGVLGAARLAVMAAHLLAAGAWLGALPALYLALRKGPGDSYPLLLRFGWYGGTAVGIVIATGLANLGFVAAQAGAGPGSLYVRVLLLKLAFVVGLLMIAALNRFWLTPRVGRAGADRALRALSATILVDQVLAVLAVAVVSVLGQLDPAM